MKITEENFVKCMKNKDEKALEFTVKNYGGLMRSVIHRILYSHPEDAEECLFESVMKIWHHINYYDESKSTFSNWAAGIAKYTALDRLRKLTKIEPTVDIDQLSIEDISHITDNALFDEFFMELISCLSDEDKSIFIRIFWIGETAEETSEALGKPKSQLYNRISRGKKKIIANNPHLFRKEL